VSSSTGFVTSARSRVRRALEQWNPLDQAAMDASRKQLELAVADMNRLVGLESLSGDRELRAELLALQDDIAKTMRALDAVAAFYGGLAVRLGRTMSAYDASGREIGA